jgi:hypothetical protein
VRVAGRGDFEVFIEGPAACVALHAAAARPMHQPFEWIFDRLPVDEFQVILETTAGEPRYTVTAADR